ncbi:MAG TPA: hypothetical protein VEA78_04065 [Acidimicrobiales bacterium]|nr:hypothetical protein [Acidimicrobiales bacterium]
MGSASAALVAASLGGVFAPPGHAQEAPPPTGGAFSNGRGQASAGVLAVEPAAGQVVIGFSSGVAIAGFRNSLAEGQAQIIDLGIVGDTLFGSSECDSSLPDIPSTDGIIPSSGRPDTPTRADSREGDTTVREEKLPIGAPGFGAGTQEVVVNQVPFANASSTPAAFEIPGVLRFVNGEAVADAGIVDGAQRLARAVSSVSITLADTVTLSGLRWEATHKSGADESAEPEVNGIFDIGRISIAGTDLPLPSSPGAESQINEALKPTGISVTLPTVVHTKEPIDIVRVTPLRIRLADSEVLRTAIGTALNQSRTFREQVLNALLADCQTAGAALIADIAFLIGGGNGSVTLEVGGADATTQDVKFNNPFGSIQPLAPVVNALPIRPGTAPAPSAVMPATDSTELTPATALPVDYEESCESKHEFEWPACSTGATLPIGVAGVVGTAVLGFLDWRKARAAAAVVS